MVRSRSLLALVVVATGLPQSPAAGDDQEFNIDLPEGFQQRLAETPTEGIRIIGFVGAERNDGTRPALVVTIIQLPEDAQKRSDRSKLHKLISGHLGELTRKWTNLSYQQSAVQLEEMAASRIAWKGKADGDPIVGVTFLAVRDRTALLLRAQDIGPDGQRTVPAMEKAMRTFSWRNKP